MSLTAITIISGLENVLVNGTEARSKPFSDNVSIVLSQKYKCDSFRTSPSGGATLSCFRGVSLGLWRMARDTYIAPSSSKLLTKQVLLFAHLSLLRSTSPNRVLREIHVFY